MPGNEAASTIFWTRVGGERVGGAVHGLWSVNQIINKSTLFNEGDT